MATASTIRSHPQGLRKLPSVYVFSYFPFGFEGRMWNLIVSVPDHCLSFYIKTNFVCAWHSHKHIHVAYLNVLLMFD